MPDNAPGSAEWGIDVPGPPEKPKCACGATFSIVQQRCTNGHNRSWGEVDRIAVENRRFADLADEAEATAEVTLDRGWATTASLLRQAASSIRWQLRWEERHGR